MTTSPAPALVDTVTAAAYIGVGPRFLQLARISGTGPRYAKLGQRVVYRLADLDAYVEAHLRSSTSEPLKA